MPQRFLKPGLTTSQKWNACSWMGQSYYVRLLTLVDDFGRCEGGVQLLRSLAFPLHEYIRTSQVATLGEELQANQLAIFYKVDGKEYVQLRNWTERARTTVSRYPSPDGKFGKWDEGPQQSAANGSNPLPPKPSSSSKPSSKPSSSPTRATLRAPNAPDVLENTRKQRPNSVELAVAQAEFAKVNEREKADPRFEPYHADEVRQAWLWFEQNKDAQTGEWIQPFAAARKPIGDWLAALMGQIGHMRNVYHRGQKDTERGKVGANEIKEHRKAKRL